MKSGTIPAYQFYQSLQIFFSYCKVSDANILLQAQDFQLRQRVKNIRIDSRDSVVVQIDELQKWVVSEESLREDFDGIAADVEMLELWKHLHLLAGHSC